MKPSPPDEVRAMYDSTADAYNDIMDSEIDLPIYAELLGRLQERITEIPGPLIDTSCGTGHMLSLYHEQYEPTRPLIGVDISPGMITIASDKFGSTATISMGDMRQLETIEPDSVAAVLSFFAIHHLDPAGVEAALLEWHRVLRVGGSLVLAAWEGAEAIDYGDTSDVIAVEYQRDDLIAMVASAGFNIVQTTSARVASMSMGTIHLESVKR